VSEQTIPAPRLGRGYTDPVEYATHLLYAAYTYFPLLAYCSEDDAKDDAASYANRPGGIAELQRYIADDPKADIPDWMRTVLREWAAEGGTQ
jgi:hypothetical protein